MFKPKSVMYLTLLIMIMAFSCSGPESDQPLLTADLPIHLEEHIDDARIDGSKVPEDLAAPVVWNFSEPQPAWKPIRPIPAKMEAVKPVRAEDALLLPLTIRSRADGPRLIGGICVKLPDWNLEDWAYVEIRARTQDPVRNIILAFNYTEEDPFMGAKALFPVYARGDYAPLVADGTVQTYRLRLDWRLTRRWEGPWTHLAICFNSRDNEEAVTLDILSVSVIPKEHIYADAPIGVKTVECGKTHRRTLYTHTPGCIEYHVQVPQAGRLDVGLGVIKDGFPVTFRIAASQTGQEETILFEETYANRKEWGQRSVDLSNMTGKTVRIALEAEAERSGTVVLWAAPTISGVRSNDKPNIIFYIIDGAGAEHMSLYGYNRRTTPNLERLAAEGALFEYAYSNSDHTKYSTPSFMSSLHNSVLGGFRTLFDALPEQAITMAQHMHHAGYQTGVFVSNPLAGSMSSLQRGVDVFRDARVDNNSTSSLELHEDFWRWRKDYPGEPYWVHFQTTDVHGPHNAPAPFAGLFVSPELRNALREWRRYTNKVDSIYDFEKTFDRLGWANAMRGVYDETMAHQDYQIGRFVERLKSSDEWEHTLLIVAADHGVVRAAGNGPDLGLLDTLPPAWVRGRFRSSLTRIPMIFVWPGKIAPEQRFSNPVSMIDMLPTILDFAGLPMPEIMQGQSLVPRLLGREGWQPRPVIFDQFRVDMSTGELRGTIDVIDGRWGASLEINPDPEQSERSRPTPLLLFDVRNDPMALHPLNDERPDLVEKYAKFLEAQWEAQQTLAKLFSRSGKVPLTPDQLEILRSLGYIR
jgi:arylsulfatase A-like enzyme